jgi:cytochrome c biogenesis protein CcmG, thiol:disulfide interchange protein DsbE
MKKIVLLCTMVIGLQTLFAQVTNQTVPSVDLKNLEGKTINSTTFNNGGKPMVITFGPPGANLA